MIPNATPDAARIAVLFIEDNPADYKLCLRELAKAGLAIDSDMVSTREQFKESLDRKTYHAVISDYRLNGWTALDALAILQAEHNSVPMILLTGALGDEAAVECIKKGVCDYLLKDRLPRLPVALCRALAEQSVREQQKQAETSLRESERRFRVLADTIAAVVLIFTDDACTYANHAAELMTEYTSDELLRMTLRDLVDADCHDRVYADEASPHGGRMLTGRHELKIRTRSGLFKWWDVTLGALDYSGRKMKVLTALDMTQRKQMEEEIRQMVVTDPLTGLGNYRRMVDIMSAEAERSRRSGRPFALILLDSDNLKKINDAFGHQVGSRALCRVANALRAACRAIDTAARIGGDEFAVVLPETDAAGAQAVADRISQSVINDTEQPQISISFGIAAMLPNSSDSVEQIFAAADAALYSMKHRRMANTALEAPHAKTA
jgi:diguanylate cyclase (GGDEF)-like protein/PAS domain S-box-containing protein